MEIQEWFRRFSAKLIELCARDDDDEFTFRILERWGRVESIGLLIDAYSETPEQAAAAVNLFERTGVSADFKFRSPVKMPNF